MYIILYRLGIFKGFSISLKLSLLKNSAWFFLLGITGLIGSRIDQYCVSLMLPKEELGQYNILKSYLLYFQAVSGFIILPFAKDIYRMSESSVKSLDKKQVIWGLLFTPLYITGLYIFMKYFYGFSFSANIYIYSSLFIPAVYFYTVKIYKMIKENRVNVIVWISTSAIIISAVLNILLIPVLKIEGALISSVIAGLFTAVLFFMFNRRPAGN
jgi:O-antigen/teichoic acid export membrane protein